MGQGEKHKNLDQISMVEKLRNPFPEVIWPLPTCMISNSYVAKCNLECGKFTLKFLLCASAN